MNALVEALGLAGSEARLPSPACEGTFEIPGEFALHHGGRLPAVRVAWRMTGPAKAPVVCALGGISASRRVCLTDKPRQSWWGEVAGPGRPLDTERYRVLSFDYLGGSGETTGPAAGKDFPSVSTYDQAQILLRLIDHLGVASLRAIAGGSYGGMVALAFGERYPERVGRLIVLCATDRPHPLGTAWRSVQRDIVRLGIDSGRPREALAIARALAMSTYRTGEEFRARFDGLPALEAGRFRLPVERYLAARGNAFAAQHGPEAFLCLSESIDLHRVEAARICVPTAAVAVREDMLVPLADVRGMVARLHSARLHEISSIYGHDAFLKESQQLHGVFAEALASH